MEEKIELEEDEKEWEKRELEKCIGSVVQMSECMVR